MKFKKITAFLFVFVMAINLLPLVAIAVTPEQHQALMNLIGIWEGRYFAAQGETGLTLEVYEENGKYRAVFNFYNLPGRTNAKNGSYTMKVAYSRETGIYSLVGEEWIERPSMAWEFVDLHGTVIGEVFSGKTQFGDLFSLIRISGSLGTGATLPPGVEVSYIRTVDDLASIGGEQSARKYYVLVEVIPIKDNWIPIADFRGTLDGAGKKITFESYKSGNFATAGLFGTIVTGTVTIKNLDVRTPMKVSTYSFFGGYNHSGVYADAHTNSNSKAYAGGLIGMILGGNVRIENCSFEGNVTARSNYWGFNIADFTFEQALGWVGSYLVGIPGFGEVVVALTKVAYDGMSENGSRSYAGGFIGFVGGDANVAIENSYSRGNIYSYAGAWTDLSTLATVTRNLSYSGGLIGWKGSNAKLSIGNAYTTASVEAHGDAAFIRFYNRGHAGGMIGSGNFDSAIGNRYRLNTAILKGHSKNSVGVSSSLSPQQMQNQSSFRGWPFSSGGWSINSAKNSGYPYLWIFDNGYISEPKKLYSSFYDRFSVKQGLGQNITLIIEKDISQVGGVSVDEITLTQYVHYTVTSGSTIITLLPNYLDTLVGGYHALNVAFNDGTYAEEQFFVADSSEDEPPVDDIYIDNMLVYSNGKLLVEESTLVSLAQNANTLKIIYENGSVFEESIPNGTETPVGESGSVSNFEKKNPFTDVKEADWFYKDVVYAYGMGLINGKTVTTFAPVDNLTYAEAVKLAACMHQLHTTGSVTLTVGSGAWYQNYADYAKVNGIITRDYEWNAPASRAGYMEIFANALPASALAAVNSVADNSIPDVPSTHPQAGAIYRLYRAGIVQGVDSVRNCNPNSNIRRSEVAAILTRMMDESARVRFTLQAKAEDSKPTPPDSTPDSKPTQKLTDADKYTVKGVQTGLTLAVSIDVLQQLGIVTGVSQVTDSQGIVTEYTFGGDALLTRQELALFTAKIASARPQDFVVAANADVKTKTTFSDLADKRYIPAIDYCFAEGYMTGRDEGNTVFDPMGKITFAEAVTTLMRAIGYTGLAYPEGYMAKASASEVRLIGEHADFPLKDVSQNAFINNTQMAMLLWNFLLSERYEFETVYNASTGQWDTKRVSRPILESFGINLNSLLEGLTTAKTTISENSTPDSKPTQKLTGRYELISMTLEGKTTTMADFVRDARNYYESIGEKFDDNQFEGYIEFLDGGLCRMCMFGESDEGTYKLDGNTIEITTPDGETLEMTLSGNRITLVFDDGDAYVFEKR